MDHFIPQLDQTLLLLMARWNVLDATVSQIQEQSARTILSTFILSVCMFVIHHHRVERQLTFMLCRKCRPSSLQLQRHFG